MVKKQCYFKTVTKKKKTNRFPFQNCNHLDLYQVYLPGEDYNFAKNPKVYNYHHILLLESSIFLSDG